MALCGYSNLGEHRQQRRRIAVILQKFRQQYENGCHSAVDELLDFLKIWLVEHIIGEDTHIKPWVKGAGLHPEELTDVVRAFPDQRS
jgi:hemerythrin